MTKHVPPKLLMTFAPEAWNGPNAVTQTNCLAYALDEPSLGWPFIANLRHAQEVSGEKDLSERRKKIRNNTRTPEMIKAKFNFVMSGLEIIRPHTYTPTERHIIAYTSGHFYRLDGNNIWSHKNGDMPATNLDETGHAIENLEGARFCKQAAQERKAAKWIQHEQAIALLRGNTGHSTETKNEHIFILRALQRLGANKPAEDLIYLALPKEGIFVNYVPPPPVPTATM